MVPWLVKSQVIRILAQSEMNQIWLQNSEYFYFGDDKEGSIYHDGTDLNISNSGGSIVFNNAMLLNVTSQAQGDVLYYNGTNWVVLAAGTDGQFLKTQGAAANPVWDDAGGGGWPLEADDGSAAAPSYSYSNDTDCGWYRIGADNIGFALNGAKVIDIKHTSATTATIEIFDQYNNAYGQMLGPYNGQYTKPFYSFKDDPDTGMMMGGGGILNIVVGGTRSITFGTPYIDTHRDVRITTHHLYSTNGNIYTSGSGSIYTSGTGYLKSATYMEATSYLKCAVNTTDVSNPPTDAELDAIWTGPATAGAGWHEFLDDAGAGNNVYLIMSDGTNWWHVALTKAS